MTMTITAAILYGSAWIATGLAVFVIGKRAERKRLQNATNIKPISQMEPETINLDDLREGLKEHGVDLHQPEPPAIDVSDLAPHHQPLAYAQSFLDDALDHYPVDSVENRLLNDCIKTVQCVIKMADESKVSA